MCVCVCVCVCISAQEREEGRENNMAAVTVLAVGELG